MTDNLRGRRQTRYEPELAQSATKMLEASGLTREEVARRSNISPEWLRQLLNLGRVISDDLLADFAEVVGGDVDELLVAAGRKQPPSGDLVKTVELALRSVSGLSKEDTDDIMKIVVEVSRRDRGQP
ncbi:helix-turn-helix transcriptional regulator [bacterium]|nr:helix-turn-helix transcriptional regulator [bacterium]